MRHGQASSAQKRKGKKGVRGIAGQRGALGWGDHGNIPARWAGGGDAYLSSDVSRRRSHRSSDGGQRARHWSERTFTEEENVSEKRTRTDAHEDSSALAQTRTMFRHSPVVQRTKHCGKPILACRHLRPVCNTRAQSNNKHCEQTYCKACKSD